MATALSFGQIEDDWTAAGGASGWAPLAAGIALAESSGNPAADNTSDPYGGSFGLWQINGSHAPGGEATTAWGASMEDPGQNAGEAVKVSGDGTNWGPWKEDRLWDQWVAAGSPPDPSAATVQGWLSAAGVTSGGSSDPNLPDTPGSAGSADLTSFNINPFDLFGIPQTVGGSAAAAVWSEIGPFLVKAILVVAGLGIVGLGLYKAASPDVKQKAGQAAQAAPEIAEAAAA